MDMQTELFTSNLVVQLVVADIFLSKNRNIDCSELETKIVQSNLVHVF